MAGQPAIFHALLRPVILQVLRAAGYHATRGAVLDSLTDLAARYMQTLCEKTAAHSVHARGDASDYTVVELRMALQDVGAMQPERTPTDQDWRGDEDTRGVEEFLEWFSGPMMKELMEMGKGDGESDATDYLSALKMKHSKTGEDSKWNGTLIGKPIDTVAEIQVEGGPITSIDDWVMDRSRAYFSPPHDDDDDEAGRAAGEGAQTNGHINPSSPSSASSGLSSVGDRLDDERAGEKMDTT
ncbi:bromodomain associated domain-containingprotein [Purpureocillium lavendulum]|uniref:Bromodomain associated domain-containingprotein n=1 Tax=Purpureocillium lavendulum TaxID=1247861 RepID=A0AB34G5I1_9HYPO|nr:bromodomain associated domain-containingprotein [Purpureocillium lavendulum]